MFVRSMTSPMEERPRRWKPEASLSDGILSVGSESLREVLPTGDWGLKQSFRGWKLASSTHTYQAELAELRRAIAVQREEKGMLENQAADFAEQRLCC